MPTHPLSPATHPYLALVVDDDPTLRAVLRQVLERSQCRVVEAENGHAALIAFRAQPMDVVLMDVMMPVMNGIEAIGHLRQLPGGRRVPILVTTALDDTNSVNDAFAAGATDFITKPLHLAVVRQRIAHMLQTRRAEDAIERAKQEWEATFDAVSDLILMTNEAGHVIRCNRAVSERLELDFTAILGRDVADLLGQALTPRAEPEQHLPRLGGWYRVDQHTLRMRDYNHQVFILHDVTREREAQARIRSLARFPEENPAPVIRVSAEGTLLYGNTASLWLLAQLGYGVAQPVTEPWLSRVRAAHRTHVSETFEQRIGNRDFAITLTPVISEGYSNLYCRDVTQQKLAEARVRESEDKLRQSLAVTEAALTEAQTLYHISRAVSSLQTLDDTLRTVVKAVAESLPADRATLFICDHVAQRITHAVGGGPGLDQVQAIDYDELMRGLSGWAIRQRQPALSPRGVSDPREEPEVKQRRAGTECGAILVVPLIYRHETFGTLTVINRPDERDFTAKDSGFLLAVASLAAGAIKNRQLYEAAQREVEERRHAEELLRESQQRYQAVVNDQLEMICRWDEAGLITFANRAYGEYMGIAPQALIGRSFVELLPGPDRTPVRARMRDLFTRLTPANPVAEPYEHRVTRPDGDQVWQYWVDRGIFDGAGRVVEIQSVGLDITARKVAEDRTRESEARYRVLFEASPISLWEEDCSPVLAELDRLRAQGVADLRAYFGQQPEATASLLGQVRILDINTATVKLYGARDKSDLIGSLGKILPPQAHPTMIEILVAMAERRPHYCWEMPNLTLSGDLIHASLQWAVAPGHEHDMARVFISLTDITARKQVEAALRVSEGRFRSLFEDAPIMYLQLRHEGDTPTIADANALALETLGYRRAEMVGQPLANFLSTESRRQLEQVTSPWEETRVVERQLVTKGGQAIDTIAHTTPERNEAGQVVGTRAAYVDVTERKRLQDQMLVASKLADIGTLAAGVAHEINSPLQVITGLTQSWLQRLEQPTAIDADRLRRNLDTIHRSGWRCAEIVRSLRTYAHAGGDQFEPADLNTVVRDSLLLIEHQLNKWSNIVVTTDYAPDLPAFACDRNQITQIIINLLTNARDAMPNGGFIFVRTELDPATGRLVLEINDTGAGIDEAIQAKVFDPFFTTKPIGKGTGLGLSIVSGIVRAHGGEIRLQSLSGQGTTFRLYFPPGAAPSADESRLSGEPQGRFDDALGSYPGEPATLAALTFGD